MTSKNQKQAERISLFDAMSPVAASPTRMTFREKHLPTLTRLQRSLHRPVWGTDQARFSTFRRAGRASKFVFVFGLTITISAWSLAEYREWQFDRSWSSVSSIRPSQLTSQFPKTEANASQIRLDELVGKLNFAITQLPFEPPKRFEPVDFFASMHARNDGAKLPAPVIDYLDAHQPVLEEMYAYLSTHPAPVEEVNIAAGFRAPFPNMLRHRLIHKTLAFDIIRKTGEGRNAEAMRAFEVSWKINEQLRVRPELISQMTASMVENDLLQLLAHMRNVPHEWQARVMEHDYSKSILLASEVDAWAAVQMAREDDLFPMLVSDYRPSTLTRIAHTLTPLTRPFFRAATAGSGLRQSASIASLSSPDAICTYQESKQNYPSSAWPWAVNNIAAWKNASRTLALQQMTRKVLQIREAYEANGLAGVKVLKNSGGRAQCPVELWDFEILSDGSIELTGTLLPQWLRPEVDGILHLPYKVNLS